MLAMLQDLNHIKCKYMHYVKDVLFSVVLIIVLYYTSKCKTHRMKHQFIQSEVHLASGFLLHIQFDSMARGVGCVGLKLL